MKNLKQTIVLFLMALSFIPAFSYAQSTNYKHQMLTIDEKGKISQGKSTVGYITKTNVVNDAKGKKIAYIDGQGNLVDAKGNLMGRMGKDGKSYENVNGDLKFSIKENGKTCNIYDESGKLIGNVHSSYKGMACVLYCFQNEMDMTDHTVPTKKQSDTDKYACPMHPEVVGKEGDKCSKCKMILKKVKQSK